MYKAVFIDMDGTLLKSDHSVSEANRQAIHHLQQKGILVIPISARPLHGMMHIIKNVVADDAPLVSLNGGYIVHKDEVIFQDAVSLHEAASVHKELCMYDLSAMYYSQMEWFAEQETDRIKKEQKITAVKIKIQPFGETLQYWDEQKNGPNKILIAGEKHLVHDIEQRLVELHGGKLNIFKSQSTYLEVMSSAASKAKAVEFLMNRYGIEQKEIIAIGDNFNDQGMIEFAGMGVAMGNAPEQIKAVANYVTDTNNNDGVAKALQYCFN
ncbi:Cof-type HAD-IIB family hydrolase [Ferruginibacter paludis]|uniref:Cof-type HAD-IIB family hydrolase n=1 Tax=Ferruginibacter paludis TaxID=1310417 RepID=UPI0025B3B002|nr:Cof-type HAD-IIB family hydrolase [Ferruginibacter paludis]MDN3657090.1 Cof-type HAD-IIB family hydrolase [Ferruginibacter paludis]